MDPALAARGYYQLIFLCVAGEKLQLQPFVSSAPRYGAFGTS